MKALVALRYVMGHIWACPPSEGDDYIFHCHPVDQKIPKPKRLQEWYRKMLDKAFAERILHDYKVSKGLHHHAFVTAGGFLSYALQYYSIDFTLNNTN